MIIASGSHIPGIYGYYHGSQHHFKIEHCLGLVAANVKPGFPEHLRHRLLAFVELLATVVSSPLPIGGPGIQVEKVPDIDRPCKNWRAYNFDSWQIWKFISLTYSWISFL